MDFSKFLMGIISIICPEKYDAVLNRIRYLISKKSGIICYFSKLCKNQFGSYDSLALEETWISHNVMIHVKSIFNKD